jgi:hypothetical protein
MILKNGRSGGRRIREDLSKRGINADYEQRKEGGNMMLKVLLAIIVFFSSLSCYAQPLETVKGEISKVFRQTKDGNATIEFAIELKDKLFILNFSNKPDFDKTMKSLPYPKKDRFYVIPKEAKGGGALQLDNGEMVYFQGGKKYEVVGIANDFDKSQLLLPESTNKKCFLLSVKKIKMLQ